VFWRTLVVEQLSRANPFDLAVVNIGQEENMFDSEDQKVWHRPIVCVDGWCGPRAIFLEAALQSLIADFYSRNENLWESAQERLIDGTFEGAAGLGAPTFNSRLQATDYDTVIASEVEKLAVDAETETSFADTALMRP